jgi:[ribosomal protein S5]-alanine N-acetyltransferase
VAGPVTGPGHLDSMIFMPTNLFDPFPVLETSRLRLRALRLEDEEEMHRVASDPLVTKYLGRATPTREKVREKIVRVLENLRSEEAILWVLTDRASGGYLGSACLWNWDKACFHAEVGYDLTPSRWGQGLVPEALAPMIRFGFEEMKLHRIEGRVHPENLGSIRVLEKLGFQKEGHLRENHFNGERFEDTAMYGLLKPG